MAHNHYHQIPRAGVGLLQTGQARWGTHSRIQFTSHHLRHQKPQQRLAGLHDRQRLQHAERQLDESRI